jgi:hypothetical protein
LVENCDLQVQTLNSRVSAETYFSNWSTIRHVADFLESTLGFASRGLRNRARLVHFGKQPAGERVLERLLVTRRGRLISFSKRLDEAHKMRMLLPLVGVGFLGFGYNISASADDVDLPIDSNVKASIIAAKKHFQLQHCVSDEFETTLEAFATYWAVTLTDDGRDGAVTCNPATVFVCKLTAKLVFDDPVAACSEN